MIPQPPAVVLPVRPAVAGVLLGLRPYTLRLLILRGGLLLLHVGGRPRVGLPAAIIGAGPGVCLHRSVNAKTRGGSRVPREWAATIPPVAPQSKRPAGEIVCRHGYSSTPSSR